MFCYYQLSKLFYIPTYMYIYIPTYMHIYIHTYMHIYIHTYMHIYIPTYLSSSSLIYIHTNVGIGCSIWILAVFLSGISKYIDSYVFLFLARMISGVGEASLQVTLPPWIHEVSPEGSTGSW